MTATRENLIASDVTVRLPVDPALAAIAERGREHFLEVVAAHPASSLCWALLAETCLSEEGIANAVAAYAYARTGYHRGLDQLRRNGWKGSGHVPWEHEPNRGFLRCLWALSLAAGRIGENEERDRCAQFLRDSSETAYQVLTGTPKGEGKRAREADDSDDPYRDPGTEDTSPRGIPLHGDEQAPRTQSAPSPE